MRGLTFGLGLAGVGLNALATELAAANGNAGQAVFHMALGFAAFYLVVRS